MTHRAVCVGIDRYSDSSIPALDGAVADAKAFAQWLSTKGNCSAADVKVLSAAQATREQILRAIEWLCLTSSAGDRVTLYFACHGSHWPGASASDQDGMSSVLLCYDHNWQFTVLRDEDILEKLRRLPAGVAGVVIWDGASTGPMPQQRPMVGAPMFHVGRFVAPPQDNPTYSFAKQRGLTPRSRFRKRRADDPNVVFVLAASDDEPAMEIPSPSGVRGAFTQSLMEVIESATGPTRWEDIVGQCEQKLRSKGQRQTPAVVIPESERGKSAFSDGAAANTLNQSGMGVTPSTSGAMNPYGNPIPAPVAAPLPASMVQGTADSTSAGSAMLGVAGALAAGAAAVGIGSLMGGGNSLAQATNPVEAMLVQFPSDAITVRACDTLFGVIPRVQKPGTHRTIDQTIANLYPAANQAQRDRAHQLANSEEVRGAIKVVDLLDTGDTGLAVFSGLKSAVGLVTGGGAQALETDTQQGIDAVVKLLALSYFVYRLYPGTIQQKVELFRITPAGQNLALYYAAVEVALPFADNVVSGGGSLLGRLFQGHGQQAMSKFGGLMGAQGASEAHGMASALLGPMESTVSSVAPHAKSITQSLSSIAGGALGFADKAAGVVATALDALPIYRYLGGLTAAETCVLLASRGQ